MTPTDPTTPKADPSAPSDPTTSRPRTPAAAVTDLVDSGRTFLGRIRARAIVWTFGLLAAAMATAAIIGGGWAAAVGTAIAAAAVAVSQVTARLDRPRCHTCGHDLTGVSIEGRGAPCPKCGALSTPAPRARRG